MDIQKILAEHKLWLDGNGGQKLDLSGLKNFDEYFKLVPGELTIITGPPGSGKSTFRNDLIQRYANGISLLKTI